MMHAQFKWTGPIHDVVVLLWNSNDLQSDIWWLLYDEATTTGKCEMEWQTNWTQLQLVWFLQGIPTKYAKVHHTEFLPNGMQNCLRFKSLSILYRGPWNKNGIPENPISQTDPWKNRRTKKVKKERISMISSSFYIHLAWFPGFWSCQTKTEVGIYFSNFLRSAAKLGITPDHTRGVELMPNIQYLHNNFIELKF